MSKLNLKLGESLDEMLSVPEGRDRKMYPTFRIESDEKPELPHEGTMTIKFKKISSEERENEDGDSHYSCVIQVHEIIDAYSDEPEAPTRNPSKETGDALDELKAKRAKKSVDY